MSTFGCIGYFFIASVIFNSVQIDTLSYWKWCTLEWNHLVKWSRWNNLCSVITHVNVQLSFIFWKPDIFVTKSTILFLENKIPNSMTTKLVSFMLITIWDCWVIRRHYKKDLSTDILSISEMLSMNKNNSSDPKIWPPKTKMDRKLTNTETDN